VITVRYDELCAQVTTRIVTAIESGTTGSWRAPWHHNGTSGLLSPTNAATAKPYAGANILLLAAESMAEGYSANAWATYRQWQQLGAQVRRGEHGAQCVKWIAKQTDDDPSDKPNTKRRMLIPKVFTVFNVAQVDDYTPPTPTEASGADRVEAAEQFIESTGAAIDYGFNSAKYRPLVDRIQLPAIDQYSEVEDHYSTVLHELVHWSGHRSRLDREMGKRFGDDAYAAEELVAELGAAFATARLGLSNTPRPDHAAYLNHWLRILGQDPKALFVVAAKAQAAVDHLASYNTAEVEEDAA